MFGSLAKRHNGKVAMLVDFHMRAFHKIIITSWSAGELTYHQPLVVVIDYTHFLLKITSEGSPRLPSSAPISGNGNVFLLCLRPIGRRA